MAACFTVLQVVARQIIRSAIQDTSSLPDLSQPFSPPTWVIQADVLQFLGLALCLTSALWMSLDLHSVHCYPMLV